MGKQGHQEQTQIQARLRSPRIMEPVPEPGRAGSAQGTWEQRLTCQAQDRELSQPEKGILYVSGRTPCGVLVCGVV